MNTHSPTLPPTHAAPHKAAIAIIMALVTLCACNSYGSDLMRVPDRSAKIQKLPNLEPVFLEGGGATSESLYRERNLFFAEARKNLVTTNNGNGDIDGYLVLTTTSTRDEKLIGKKFSTELKLQILDRYGNEIKQYNEAAKGGTLGPGFDGPVLIYKDAFEKIIKDLAKDVPNITQLLGGQQGTPRQAAYIANLVVGNQINTQQIAEIARINKANQDAIEEANRQQMLQGIAAIAGGVQAVGSTIQQQQYQRQQAQYQQQQAQQQQQQVAQNTGSGGDAAYWQAKANKAATTYAKKEAVVEVKKELNTATGGAIANPTQNDLFLRNQAHKDAISKQNLADSARRADERRAEAAASTPVAGNPPPPPPPPLVIAPVPDIAGNATPVVLQQAPQYTAPVAAADYKQQVSPTPAQQPASTAFSQQVEGGTAEADKLFRMGLNAATSADASKNFNASDTAAELAREHYYSDANPANARQQSQAFTFFTYAAKQGNRPAMYHLALMYKYGRGTPQNDAEAAKWLAAAAAASYEPAIQLQNKTN